MPRATAPRTAPTRPVAATAADPHDVPAAPVVLLTGPEDHLADIALSSLLARLRAQDAQLERTDVAAAGYLAGQLATWASPSLFDERSVVVVDGAEAAGDAFVGDVTAYLADPSPSTVLVVRHRGGNRARKVLETARAVPGAVEVACQPLKRDQDKIEFVLGSMRRARRRMDADAARALVDALGNELGELAAACDQLCADTEGTITAEDVRRYHGGRVEATGFDVADAAVEGHAGRALALLRHASATGVVPVLVVAALASRLRTLAKVGAERGRSADLARDLGMAPWQVDRARRDLQHWSAEALGEAIRAVAQADAAVKGAGPDGDFALERAVVTVATARGR
ncbi:DNA polymerase III delta subunit [Kineococcus xinjiangensis]|uniref:DNA-directed DNA polymerase n=1 Tax=Kineococcus xinjiangensis TaxID=512762 RepID=A0A2S6IIU9_9ACTN|nr:DNA polymerase III subunit delta [Kineococcus xinjiangensis]PPK94154.1 DNA polymerase III delta subunit [Kineococcus xinjiangensis]